MCRWMPSLPVFATPITKNSSPNVHDSQVLMKRTREPTIGRVAPGEEDIPDSVIVYM